MVLECFACIAFTYSCTKLVDYPESSVPLVFCILKSCLESISIMPLAQCQSFQFLQRWYFERFRGDFRHSVQLQVFGAVSSRRFFFGTLGQCVENLERSSGLQSGSPWTLTSHLQAYVIVCFLVFKNLKNRIGVLVAVIQQLQVFENHWMSLWLKFESLERTLGQDTNNWHLQQKLKCLWVVLRVVGFLVDRSEEAVVKWCHLLRYSFRYFKSGRSVLKRVIIPQQQRSTWSGTGSATTAWQPELIRQIKRRNPKLSATLFN